MSKLLPMVLCLALWGIFGARADEPPPAAPVENQPLITVSKETTHITEPLLEDGRVDYFAAYEQYAKRGVTVDNNAGVLIVQALGPEIVPEEARAAFFERLGISPLPAEGKYLKSLSQFLGMPAADADNLLDRGANRGQDPWKRADAPALYQWIVQNEHPLLLVQQASYRPRLYIPTYLDVSGMEKADPRVLSMILTGVEELREIARILRLRAMLRLGEGDVQGAHEDLMTIHRLARLAGQSPVLVTRLVACALEGIACSADSVMAHHGQLTSASAIAMRAELERLPPLPGMAEAMDVGERFCFLDVAQAMAYGGVDALSRLDDQGIRIAGLWAKIPTGTAINFDVAMRMGNETFDRVVACLEEPDVTKRAELAADIERELQEYSDRITDPKSLALAFFGGRVRDELGQRAGEVLLSLLLPSITTGDRAHLRTKMRTDFARLAYALAAYRADHQRYPASLELLVPKYIDRVPLNPFSGVAPQYQLHEDGYSLSGDNITVRVPTDGM